MRPLSRSAAASQSDDPSISWAVLRTTSNWRYCGELSNFFHSSVDWTHSTARDFLTDVTTSLRLDNSTKPMAPSGTEAAREGCFAEAVNGRTRVSAHRHRTRRGREFMGSAMRVAAGEGDA